MMLLFDIGSAIVFHDRGLRMIGSEDFRRLLRPYNMDCARHCEVRSNPVN